jgi:ribose 5-phosphate isomerase B
MKIAVGADERLHVVDVILDHLAEEGYEVIWHGPDKGDAAPWPQVAHQVGEDVAAGRAESGILFCWTGTGVSIAANKVRGIRAALCEDAETARGAKLWNNANVLCMSLRRTSEVIAKEIIQAWFDTAYLPNPVDDGNLALLEKQEG